MSDLKLIKGGKIVVHEWELEEQKYYWKEIDVESEEFIEYIYYPIELEPNLNLRDVFLLISKNIRLFSIVSGCSYLEELVDEVLSQPQTFNKDIIGLLLYRQTEIRDDELIMCVSVCGLTTGNETIPIESIPANTLVLYPIIDCNKLIIEEKVSLPLPFTVNDVIRGIVESFTAYGPPSLRDVLSNITIEEDAPEIEVIDDENDK
jgi:hypothetical protein